MRDSGSDGRIQIDVWEIVQYYYCPRKLYFLRTLGTPSPGRRFYQLTDLGRDFLKQIGAL